ncbi:MAG: hypothetical protein JNL70_20445 [Saprospiraceae bacterium]|nr:hypothetical protein [Saprospiraceae bacterium]
MNKLVAFFLMLFMILSSCNTTVHIETDSNFSTPVTIKEQPLLIVWESTDLTKEFMISFKNYLQRALTEKGIQAQIVDNKNASSAAYVLECKVISDRGRDLYHATGVVKSFREATIDVAVKNTEGVIVKKSQAHVNHVYSSEVTTAARKAAYKVVEQFKITR